VRSYRARRRPRAPRYPSLQLKFEPVPQPEEAFRGIEDSDLTPRVEKRVSPEECQPLVPAEPVPAPTASTAETRQEAVAPPSGKIIEFPRSSPAPPQPLGELAEPVPDRLRIVEAPEFAPAPPALGGILIQPSEEPKAERRPGFEIPLQSAAMLRRMFAAATDGVLILCAVALFGFVFLRITQAQFSVLHLAVFAAVLAGILWSGYHYLLLVHTGTTPGLKLTRLHLARFDGSQVPRSLRRWRVLASILSGLSLGLGYAWCLLDQDELCWHDRITRTYMAPKPQAARRPEDQKPLSD